MSERNGDKARFGRERKRKIRRRKHVREIWLARENKPPKASSGPSSAK